jgi:thymidylate kinase
MQPFIIFEGIASSGKTTLERMLQEKLEGSVIVSEGQTLMPLIENKEPQKAVEHLSAVLDEIEKQSAGAFIVDRFHLTHAFRTSASISLFDEIEKRIHKQYKPLIVLLQMDEGVISDRIKETAALRGASWAKGKQGSLEEKVAYYKDQQRLLSELIKQSSLPTLILDTTDKDWSRCIADILGVLAVDSAK